MLSSFKPFLLLDCLVPPLLQCLGSAARDNRCLTALSPALRGRLLAHLSVTSTVGLQVVDLAAAKLDLLTTPEKPTAILEETTRRAAWREDSRLFQKFVLSVCGKGFDACYPKLVQKSW